MKFENVQRTSTQLCERSDCNYTRFSMAHYAIKVSHIHTECSSKSFNFGLQSFMKSWLSFYQQAILQHAIPNLTHFT